MKAVFSILIISLVFVLSSCSLTYIPSAPVVFNHEKEGDLSLDLRQGGYSTNFQGGYAITDNFNLGMSFSSLYTGDVTVSSVYYEGTSASDLSLIGGYYTKLSDNAMFEINTGFGSVFMSNEAFKAYTKLYLQPTIGFRSKSQTTAFNIGLRTVGTSRNYVDSQVDTLYYNGFIEPFLSLSTGRQVHFLMQAGLSTPIIPYQIGEASPFIFNIGIGYTINTKSEKQDIGKQVLRLD